MTIPFIGRAAEIKNLRDVQKQKTPTLVVIKGRRRIGKSRLVEEFAKHSNFLRFSGLAPLEPMSAQDQRDAFKQQLGAQLGCTGLIFKDWADIFDFLGSNIPQKPCVILFDEISWMGSKDPTFLPKLKNAWDMVFSKHNHLTLILCGSVSTWVEKNILNSTAFFGRVGLIVALEDLSLFESVSFLKAAGLRTSPEECLKFLSILGGIPWYLERLKPSHTADENIKQLCFTKSGLLVEEFDRIFHDLFSIKGAIYRNIIQILSVGHHTLCDLQEALKYPRSGTLSQHLKQLITAGFVSSHPAWSLKKRQIGKQSFYQLCDPYIRFYIKYMQPRLTQIKNGSFDYKRLSDLPEWSSIMGLQLETLLLKNRKFIWELLNIHPQDILWDNPYNQKGTQKQRGIQVDYLIHTQQKVLYICEIKFSRQPIGVEIQKEVAQKIENLSVPKGFAVCPILIHTSSLTDNLLDSQFFFKTIDLNEVLENVLQ